MSTRMQRSNTLSAIGPLLQHRTLRVLLVAAPGIMAAVAVFSATESNLALAIVLNIAAGIVISSTLFIAVSLVARRVADERISLVQAAEQGFWSARAQSLSIHHDETGLYADWYFRLRLQEEIERSQRYDVQVAVLLAKIQRTDAGGPGHKVREWFGDHIQRKLRRSDLLALLRDGSLGVMLPGTGHSRAEVLGRRLVKALASADARVGLACFPGDGENVTELLKAAARSAAAEPKDERGVAPSTRPVAAT